MIRSRTDSEAAAIEQFFTLLDEFAERKPRLVARLSGFRRTYTTYTQTRRRHDDKSKYEVQSAETVAYPDSIALITSTDDPGFFANSETDVAFPHTGFFPTMKSFELKTGASRDMLTILDSEWAESVTGDT